jgi:molecular chaperone GrpE
MHRLGLEEVPGEGADFDPNLHEALAVTPVAEQEQDGKVLMVHTAGYAVKGKVLQAAQVVIGKYQEAAGEA